MKTLKITLLAIALAAAPVITHAMEVNIPVPCSNSGALNITGTYDEMSGAINLALQPQDCKQNGYTITGNGSVTGIFKPSMTDPTKFETDLKNNMDADFVKDAEHLHATFTLEVKGKYDLTTSKFDDNAQFKTSINGTGPISANIIDLITVDFDAITNNS